MIPTNTDRIMNKLAELSEGQAVIRTQIVAMQETVLANTKLLRGNGVPGLTTEIALLKEEVIELKASIPDEVACRKDMKDIKMRVEDYPSYLWLLKNKTKSTVMVTIVVLFVGFVIVSPLVDHGMFAAILSWIGVPAAVIKQLVGT
jgi:hypothetical protein